MKRILLLGALIAVGFAYFSFNNGKHEELFTYPENTIWGKSKEDSSIKPFTVKIDPKHVEDLKLRLSKWRRHEPLEGVGRSYGITPYALENLVKHLLQKFDYKQYEAKLNLFPQFTTVIQGLKVHFLHVKGDPKASKRIPVLLVHGWPGSVVEFHQVIPMLTSIGDNDTAFDIIAPSIPGFGFSEAASKPGLNDIAIAQVFHVLMKRLGYEKFIYQAGDAGSMIGNVLVRIFPESVIGYHVNLMMTPTYTTAQKLRFAVAAVAPGLILDEKEAAKLQRMPPSQYLEMTGYFHMHATKPDTLGVSLADSPVALLAWIGEKFEAAVERAEFKGDLPGPGVVTNDEILSNILVYWFNNNAASASRWYKELVQSLDKIYAWYKQPIQVPVAYPCYPRELACAPKRLLKKSYTRHLVHYVDMPRGGHFAALEEPELFVNDFRKAVWAFEKYWIKQEKKRLSKLQATA